MEKVVDDTCAYDQCFIVLEKKFFELDPIKSQGVLAVDKDLKSFNTVQGIHREAHEKNNESIKKSANFSKYKVYWENENLSIYQFEK